MAHPDEMTIALTHSTLTQSWSRVKWPEYAALLYTLAANGRTEYVKARTPPLPRWNIHKHIFRVWNENWLKNTNHVLLKMKINNIHQIVNDYLMTLNKKIYLHKLSWVHRLQRLSLVRSFVRLHVLLIASTPSAPLLPICADTIAHHIITMHEIAALDLWPPWPCRHQGQLIKSYHSIVELYLYSPYGLWWRRPQNKLMLRPPDSRPVTIG